MKFPVAVVVILASWNCAQAFLDTPNSFCTENDVARSVLRQTEPMTAYKHGDNYAFLTFQKQRDMALMFDRPGDFLSTKTINPRHHYDSDVDGYTLAPKDMVAFFEYARAKKVPLNSQEKKLQESLLENGSMALENNRYVLKKPVYLGAAHKNCGRGTAEHELNHLLFDSTATYRDQIKRIYNDLKPKDRKMVITVLGNLGYDKKTLSVEENLLGEFAAFFRDPETLRISYAKELAGVSQEKLSEIAQSLKALEKDVSLFSKCPDGVRPPADQDDSTTIHN